MQWTRTEEGRRSLFAIALLPVLSAVFAISTAGAFAEHTLPLTAGWIVGGLAWILAIRIASRGSGNLTVVIAGAVALRVLAASGDPGLSDDVYRYLWEGEVVLEGESPYSSAPADFSDRELPVGAGLRSRFPELWDRVGHKEVRGAYPPLAQAVGTACAGSCRLLGAQPHTTGVTMLRLFFGLCDLVVIWPLAKLLVRVGLPPAMTVVWAWCPLVVLEFAGSAHLDSLGILLLVGALAAGRSRLELVPSILLSAGILAKYVPGVAAPWIVRGRRAALKAVVVATLVAAGFAPFLLLQGSSQGLFAGLGEYAFRWESASILHRFLEGFFARFFRLDESWSDPRRLARATEAITWIAIAIHQTRRESNPVRGAGVLVGAWLVLSPTLHPWYLCWILPFLALRFSIAWTWLILAAPLLQAPLRQWQSEGIWIEPPWLWPIFALPFLAILAWELLGSRDSRAHARSA